MLMIAAENDRNLTLEYLIREEKSNVNAVDKHGTSALGHCCWKGKTQPIMTLLSNNANPNLIDRFGLSPLHKAVASSQLLIVIQLLKFKGDVNIKTGDITVPLTYHAISYHEPCIHIATRNGNLEMMELLLKNYADPNIKNKFGDTALHIAFRWIHPDAISLLLRYGGTPSIYIENNHSFLPSRVCGRIGDENENIDTTNDNSNKGNNGVQLGMRQRFGCMNGVLRTKWAKIRSHFKL